MDGDPRTEIRWTIVLGVDFGGWPLSNTPNSVASLPAEGEGPREDATPDVPMIILALLLAPPLPLSVGEFVVDERLEIRGIFVGVSFDRAELVLSDDGGGGSLKP